MARYIFFRIHSKKHSPRTVGIYYLILSLFTCSAQASIATEWKYSKATNELANGNYVQAQGLMQSILVDEPSRPDVLYDLGVASFKNKEYSQSAAYFASAAQAEGCPLRLQEQSYFNLGNANVELKQLNDAIVHYEKVLELNEKNEQAQHNLEVVKKMLEDQKQQEQQDKDDQQDKDQKDDQNKDDQDKDKQDKNSKDGQNGDDGDDDKNGDQNESKNDPADTDDDSSHASPDASNSAEATKDRKASEDRRDQQSKEKNKENSQKNSPQGDQKDQDSGSKDKKENPSDQKDKQNNANKQQPKSDDSNKQVDAAGQKGDKDRNGKDKKDNAAGAQPSSMQKEPDLAPEDQWILQVLNQRENDEKKTNKQLIRASIDKKLGGQHGQNCW